MLNVGYLALSKESWRTELITNIVKETKKQLDSLEANVIGSEDLITNENSIKKICDEFRQVNVKAIVVHFATFPIGAAIPEIAKNTEVPLILLANPEEEHTGGVLQQNSFCGANMAAHTLHQMGRKYSFVWSKVDETAANIREIVDVIDCITTVETTKFGLVGGRVPGFYTSNFSELKLRQKFGVAVEVMDLAEVFETAKAIDSSKHEQLQDEVYGSACCCSKTVKPETVSQAGNLLAAFRNLSKKYSLDGFAVRCWPEFPDIYGMAPCAVLGILNDTGLIASCEGDIHGALTMQLMKCLSGGMIPFFVDLIKFDYKENTGVVWHCGAAPSSLCRNSSETGLQLHMRVDGGDKKGLTNDFPLKSGRITLAKLDESPEGKYRMLIATGEALDTEPFIRGNPLNIRFDPCTRELIETIMRKGFEHHYCVVHSEIRSKLEEFCRWMDIETVVVE